MFHLPRKPGLALVTLESFPRLRKLSLILDFHPIWRDSPENLNDLQGAVTLLTSKQSTTTLCELRFICDSLMHPKSREFVLGENILVHELEAILLAEPYTTTVRVAFQISAPTKRNEARHVEEAIKTAFPALQEKGLLHVVFSRACKLVLLFYIHHKGKKTDRPALAQLDLVTTVMSIN